MPEPITVVAAGASLVFVLLVLGVVLMLRRRDPVGRAVAGHAVALDAIRESAIRAARVVPAPATDDRTPVSVVASPYRDGPPAT